MTMRIMIATIRYDYSSTFHSQMGLVVRKKAWKGDTGSEVVVVEHLPFSRNGEQVSVGHHMYIITIGRECVPLNCNKLPSRTFMLF